MLEKWKILEFVVGVLFIVIGLSKRYKEKKEEDSDKK